MNDIGNLGDYYYKPNEKFWDKLTTAVEVVDSWKKVGIIIKTQLGGDNMYILNDREISREDAMKHAAVMLGQDPNSIDFSKY